MNQEQQESLVDAVLEVAARKEMRAKAGTLDPAVRVMRLREVDLLLSLAILIERWNTLDENIRAWQFSQLRKRCGAPERLLKRITEALEDLDNSQMCG